MPDMETIDNQAILVTGASGYLATHIVQQLQEEGYHVRGTVRDLSNEANVNALKELCPEAKHALELVEADLTKEDSWESVVNGCKYVIHTASPFPSAIPKNADDVIKPAVDGTLAILKACQKAHVTRLVMTSSVIAVYGSAGQVDPAKTYTEEDWAADSEKPIDAYSRSKKAAEKAAWDFIKELPEEERFELAVMNPGFILGPVLGNNGSATSVHSIKQLLESKSPVVPKISTAVVDVRDVAAAHVKALTVPEAAGNRHILMASVMTMQEIAQVIAKEFKSQGYKVPTVNCPNAALKVAGVFNKQAKGLASSTGKAIKLESTRMKDVLGVTPRDTNETIIEMCYNMIERGLAKKTKKYRGPKKEGDEEPAQEANGEVDNDVKEANGEVKASEEEATEEKKNGEAEAATTEESKENGEAAPEEAKTETTESSEPTPAENGDSTEKTEE